MKSSNSATPPIKLLINKSLKEKRLSRSDLVKAIGYTNVSKGCKRLDTYLETLEYPSQDFINRLLSVLRIDPVTLYRSLEVTLQNLTNEAARNFKPYIQILLSIQPTPHFAAGLVYRMCRICVPPSFLDLPLNEELEAIHSLYLNHREDVLNEKLRNSISGFRYHRSAEYCLMFDPSFKLVETHFVQSLPSGKRFIGNRIVSLLAGDLS